MGYQSDDGRHKEWDDGRHKGWAAAQFPDGRVSVGSENGGAMVRFIGPGLDPDAGCGVLDGRTAIGWRGVCTCGWRGALWQWVSDADQHDPAARRLYAPDPATAWDAPVGFVYDAIHREWRSHHVLAAVRETAGAVRAAQAQLDEAVRAGRGAGCSWAEIGDAAGMTRQSAHERWARREELPR